MDITPIEITSELAESLDPAALLCPELARQVEAKRRADPDEPVALLVRFSPLNCPCSRCQARRARQQAKAESCQCGCAEHDQCRQAAMAQAQAAAVDQAAADGTLKEAAKHFSANSHLKCPADYVSATGTFDPAGYDPLDCAGCGLPRSAHIPETNGHDVSQPEPCGCTLCSGSRAVRESMLNLAASYSAHAQQCVHDARQRTLKAHCEYWREMAANVREPHGRKRGGS